MKNDLVVALYTGSIKFLQPEGEKTGIYKSPVNTVQVNENGFIGDIQVDRRFHGGPEKAVHQFSILAYKKIVEHFPTLHSIAIPGSIGENLSSHVLDDTNVCIGDTYRFGKVVLQVSQPRRPCWKINQKFDNPKLVKFLIQSHVTGWYYRVIETGSINMGDKIELVERLEHSISIQYFNEVTHAHRPNMDELEKMINCPGLSEELKPKLESRAENLKTKFSNHSNQTTNTSP